MVPAINTEVPASAICPSLNAPLSPQNENVHVHSWKIEESAGSTSEGTCEFCGEVRGHFKNSTNEGFGWKDKKGKKVGFQSRQQPDEREDEDEDYP